MIPSPYGRQRPLSSRASGSRSTNSARRRDLPTPADPNSVTSCGTRSRTTRVEIAARTASSSSLPMIGADSPSIPRRSGSTRGVAREPRRGPDARLPFAAIPPRSSYSTSRLVAARVRSPTSTSPGSAACCSRAATLTASPLTISSPRAADSRLDTTSPVLTPMRSPTSAPWRAAMRAAKPLKRVAGGEGRQHGALGIVLVRLRDPEHGQHRVADELLRQAPEALDLAVDELEQLSLQLTHVLGIEALAERCRACEIGEEDADDAALLALVASGSAALPPRGDVAPHAEQNAAPAGCSVPQSGQVRCCGAPQAPQKRASGETSTPQATQARATLRVYFRPHATAAVSCRRSRTRTPCAGTRSRSP